MKIDLEQIRDLLAVVGQTDITELTIESGDQKITIKKSPAGVTAGTFELATAPVRVAAPAPAPVPVAVAAATAPAPEAPKPVAAETKNGDASSVNGLVPITSPMVGTFYRSPSPTAPPFVDVGDRVSAGQTVCIIEAMKLMNDMPSEVAGKIVKVCVENGTTVEYGQPLFMVDPNG